MPGLIQKILHIKLLVVLIFLTSIYFFVPAAAFAATGDISAVRITTNGWYAEVDITGFVTGGVANYGMADDGNASTVDNDPAGAKVIFTVTSQGYNTSGVLGTITRTVYGTETLRKPFPNEADLDESASGGTLTIKVALSDFIYADDENGGAGTSGTDVTVSIPAGWYTDSVSGGNAAANLTVTNNSTLPYPKVIGRWAWPGYEKVSADFLVEAVAFHRFGQYGKPIAAIAFQANDQSSNSTYATTTDMTITTRSGDVNTILVYAATMDIDALDQGEVIDINFRAYPWVGDESSILDSRTTADGYSQPDERLGPLHVLNDKSGTYGAGYAYVSRSTGDNTTGTVYSTQAAAEAGNAYLTIGAAAAAIKTYHNTNLGRNSAGGGVILLAEGDHPYPGSIPSGDLGTTMETWLTIKPASTAARANTKISSGTNSSIKGTRIKMEGLTLSPSVASGGGITGRVAGDTLWLHGNAINATSTVPFFAWRTAYSTQNDITALSTGFSAFFGSTRGPFALVRGNNSSVNVTAHFYAVLGNKNVTGDKFIESAGAEAKNAGMATSTNAIFAFNTVYNLATDVNVADTSTSTAIAIVQNMYERVGGDPTGVMTISAASGNGATTTNILYWHNTAAGGRHQWGYNSTGSTTIPKLNWGSKFNLFTEQGIKSDDFTGDGGGDGNRTGNWPLTYNVGNVGNKSLTSSFEGEFHGLFAQWGETHTYLTPGFVDDNSKETGSDTGSGDYTLLPTSISIDSATTTDSFHMVLPYDLLGNPRYGSPDTGAYEYQPLYTMSTHAIATGTAVRMYGDEKWRTKAATTTSGTADLSVTIPGTDRSQWLDIIVSTWENSDTRHKVWTETSSTTALTNTVHVVGDLDASTYYEVSVDGSLGNNITGASCTSGVCLSNASGEITFTYTGSYSTHTFDVEEQEDSTAPTILDITSDTADGTYDVGSVIDIDVTFSEAVTSTGNITVTLETGATDQTCTFTVTSSATGTCDYTVQEGDSSADLTVSTISGTIDDAAGNEMANFTPTTNLAANKALVIDTAEEEEEEDEVPVSANGPASGQITLINQIKPREQIVYPDGRVVYLDTPGTNPTIPQNQTNTSPLISRTLRAGNVNEEVKYLQQFLAQDVELYPEGLITGYFGVLTELAVQRFQKKYDIIQSGSPATTGFGVVGPLTRKKLNELSSSSGSNTAVQNETNTIPAPSASTTLFMRDLEEGLSGDDVKALQIFLNVQGFLISEEGPGSIGNETTYFGLLTRQALARFQKERGIAPAVGYFGPVTRAAVHKDTN